MGKKSNPKSKKFLEKFLNVRCWWNCYVSHKVQHEIHPLTEWRSVHYRCLYRKINFWGRWQQIVRYLCMHVGRDLYFERLTYIWKGWLSLWTTYKAKYCFQWNYAWYDKEKSRHFQGAWEIQNSLEPTI